MSLVVRDVGSHAEMRRFIVLPGELHAEHIGWVPPIYMDDRKTFDSRHNLAHRYCDSVCALAYEDRRVVGRIAGIINYRYNSGWNVKHARFGYLESIHRDDVARALLDRVERWAREKEMTKIVGPMGFTEEDPEGFRIEGFEHPPNLSTYCNDPFLPQMVERLGYTKEVDYVVYEVPLATAITESYRRIYERICRRKELALVEFTHRKELAPYVRPIFRLMNECFRSLYGYSALDDEEMDRLARRYLPVVDPRFIKVVVDKHNELIGFIIGIPSIADGLRKARGRLFPFGILRILLSRRRSRKLDLYLGGIKEQYRGRGADIVMGYHIIESARRAGFEIMDSHHELETNVKMRAEMERIGGRVYKRYRIFQKSLL
jgi:predicted GNAT family acetyltransferase